MALSPSSPSRPNDNVMFLPSSPASGSVSSPQQSEAMEYPLPSFQSLSTSGGAIVPPIPPPSSSPASPAAASIPISPPNPAMAGASPPASTVALPTLSTYLSSMSQTITNTGTLTFHQTPSFHAQTIHLSASSSSATPASTAMPSPPLNGAAVPPSIPLCPPNPAMAGLFPLPSSAHPSSLSSSSAQAEKAKQQNKHIPLLPDSYSSDSEDGWSAALAAADLCLDPSQILMMALFPNKAWGNCEWDIDDSFYDRSPFSRPFKQVKDEPSAPLSSSSLPPTPLSRRQKKNKKKKMKAQRSSFLPSHIPTEPPSPTE